MSRRRVFMSVVLAISTSIVVVGAAKVAIPNDPWVGIDQLVPTGDLRPGPALTRASPLHLRVKVSSVGLDRIDLRFHFAEVDPARRGGAVRLQLRDPSTNKLMWTSDLDAKIVPQDGWTQLMLPHVSQHEHRSVTLTLAPTPALRSAVGVWSVPCDCMRMSKIAYGDEAAAGDPDAAYFARQPSAGERLHTIAGRINDTHPVGFRTHALIAAGAIGSVAFVVLVALLAHNLGAELRRMRTEGDVT